LTTTHDDAPIPSPFPDPLSSFKFARVHGREAGETSSAPPPQKFSKMSLTSNDGSFGVADRDGVAQLRSGAARASTTTSGGLGVGIRPASVTETSKLPRTIKPSGRRLDQRNHHADAAAPEPRSSKAGDGGGKTRRIIKCRRKQACPPRSAAAAAAISTQEVLQGAVLLESGLHTPHILHIHNRFRFRVSPRRLPQRGGSSCITPRCGEADSVGGGVLGLPGSLPSSAGDDGGAVPPPMGRLAAFWGGGLARVRARDADWLA
jgi:hypothetical protein